MPEIEFSIDTTTGELRMNVNGIAGPACGDVAKLAKELLGTPAREEKTAEHYVQPIVRCEIRRRSR